MKTLLVGLGNVLAQDDGAGILCVEEMQKEIICQETDFLICGTDILKIMNRFENQERIIIIDAIDAKLTPGTVICLREKGLSFYNDTSRSVHQISAVEGIGLIKNITPCFEKTEIFFIGIQIEDTRLNQEISKEVKYSISLVKNILKQIILKK